MSRIVEVQLSDDAGKITFIGGKLATTPNNYYDKRDFLYGLSVFYNGKYVRNFVILKSELDIIEQVGGMVAIDDLNWILLADDYSLKLILNEDGRKANDEQRKEYGIQEGNNGAWMQKWSVSYLRFNCANRQGFLTAIKQAMDKPLTSSNLFHSIPEGCEVVEY